MQQIRGSVARELNRTIKLYVAFLLTKGSRWARQIKDEQCWLIGSMSGRAYADNSAALHRYLVENCPDIRVYWVINRDSPDVERVRQLGRVLYREDVATYVYGLQARVQIISHGLADVPTCGYALSKGAVKVRLGHGLTALKRTKGSLLRSVQAKNRVFDLVPVSSAFEKENKLSWGIDPDRLAVTGLPRFDELLRKQDLYQKGGCSDPPHTRILYMPTWRDWLPRGRREFVESEFYRQVRDFLGHPGLNDILAAHDMVLYVHLHIIAQQHLAAIVGDIGDLTHVKVLPASEDLQDAIVRSSLLITDYSSVAWDFLYLDKPVVFYQFDVERFNEVRGAYVDFRDLFGPVARNPKSAVEVIRYFLERNYDCGDYRANMDRWQRKAFQYRDDRNCERVVRAILDRLGEQGS
jgi:CDP-glycerol glycerophosphotransferase (TagB/SpsB family)